MHVLVFIDMYLYSKWRCAMPLSYSGVQRVGEHVLSSFLRNTVDVHVVHTTALQAYFLQYYDLYPSAFPFTSKKGFKKFNICAYFAGKFGELIAFI